MGECVRSRFAATPCQIDHSEGRLDDPYTSTCALQGSFFLGEELSMVDVMFLPFVERMVSSLLYYKGFTIRGNGMFPGIDDWFRVLELRDSYLAFRSDHYTHCHDLPPQLGGVCVQRELGHAPVAGSCLNFDQSYLVPVRDTQCSATRLKQRCSDEQWMRCALYTTVPEHMCVSSPALLQGVRCTRMGRNSRSR